MHQVHKGTEALMNDILMTPMAVARVLEKSEQTVRVYAMTGKLPFVATTTGRRLFRKSDVEEFAKRQNEKNHPPVAA